MNTATFLQLAPEFGGTKFGPFRGGEIRLGSDPASNDISIPADLGVLPQHVKILQQNDTSFIVAPVDRTATVYIWREGKAKPKQIVTPMAVQIGDGFSLVSPEGHRFYILSESLRKDKESAGGSFKDKAMKRMPTSRGLFEEVKRRGFAKVFATSFGNSLMYAYRFVVTGQIFSPMYIVAGILLVSSWLFAGGATCSAFTLNSSANDYASKWQECKDQRDGTSKGEAVPTVAGLTKNVLAANGWEETIRDDSDLSKAYRDKLKIAFSDLSPYKAHYANGSGQFAQFRNAIARGTGDDFANTIGALAAHPSGGVGDREWRVIEDSEGKEVCGRGPLALTYRQAKNLGLENVQLDALVSESIALSTNPEDREKLLRETAAAANESDVSFAGTVLNDGGTSVTGGRYCLHVEGDDDRTDIGKLSRAIKAQIGLDVRGLPEQNASHWLGLRLYKLAAMDFITYRDIANFQTTSPPSLYLDSIEGTTTSRVDFANKFAGRAMAQGVVLRCAAVLDKTMLDSPPEHIGELPPLHQCAVLKAYVDYGFL